MSPTTIVDLVRVAELYSYATVVILTIVGYDFVLTFSRELDCIWHKPWTRVSVLFLIVRYVGLCWAVNLSLAGGIFVPGPIKVSIAILVAGDWGYMLFIAAADLVMVLRVFAMWNKSKTILGILLCCYVPQLIVSIVWEILYVIPGKSMSVTISQILNFNACNYVPYHNVPSGTFRAIPRFVFGGVLLVLAVIPTLMQAVRMYRLTKCIETNTPMKLLMKEGAVYFIVNVLFNIVNAITLPDLGLMVFLNTISYALSCILMPRFIMNVRELYDNELLERCQGIDTGFGTWSEQTGTTDSTVTC